MSQKFKVLTVDGVRETEGQVFLALVKNDGHLWVSSFIYTDDEQLKKQMGQDQFSQAKELLKVSVDLSRIQPIKKDDLHTDKT